MEINKIFDIDFARGLVYEGNRGYFLNRDNDGFFIVDGNNKIFLTENNSMPLAVEDEGRYSIC